MCSHYRPSQHRFLRKNGASPIDALMLGVKGVLLTGHDVEQAQAMIGLGLPKTEVAARVEVSRQTLYAALRRVASSAGP